MNVIELPDFQAALGPETPNFSDHDLIELLLLATQQSLPTIQF